MLSWLHSLPDHHPREWSTLRVSDPAGGRWRCRTTERGQSYREVLCTSQEAQVNKAPTASYGSPRSQLMVTSRQTGRRLAGPGLTLCPQSTAHTCTHPLTSTYPHRCTHRPKHMHMPTHTHPRTYRHRCTHMHVHAHTYRHRFTHTHTPMQHTQGCTRRSAGPPGLRWSLLAPHPARASIPPGAKGSGTVTSHDGPALTLCGHITLFSCAALLL